MFDALAMGDVLDQATPHTPARRDLTVGEAVKAMVLNGLGFLNQALYLVPRFFPHKPTSRRIAPRVAPDQLNDDALGRTLETLYDDGVTALYSLLAATAAERLGLAPRCTHRESTSFHVAGRDTSDDEPSEHVVHRTKGYRRAHRPALNHVMLEWIGEPQAGIPGLMKPRSGNSNAGHEFGDLVHEHLAPRQTTYGPTYLVADSALYREANLQQFANTQLKWMTRVPATFSAAQAALAHAHPHTMRPLSEGDRDQRLHSTDGGVAQRWALLYSEPRPPQAQRTADQHWRTPSDQDLKACQQLGPTAVACEADALQALSAYAQGVQVTQCAQVTIRPIARYGTRGRPGLGAQPVQVVYQVEGALASALAARQARITQQSGVLLATHALDDQPLPPQALLDGDKGQSQAERGCRFVKDPQFLASSRYLKKPERLMALLRSMTVCWLGDAALAYRIRTALKDHGATCPDQQGQPVQNPTARWIFHYVVGIHLLSVSGQWPLVFNLTEEHGNLLKLLGQPYMPLYGVKYS
jgi:transposase